MAIKLDIRVEQAKALKELRENMPAIMDSLSLNAKLTRIKYDALIAENFTPEQAVELCKAPL